MPSSEEKKIRFQISFVKSVWVVTIHNGENTENRSFREEIEARDYGMARINQLLSNNREIRIDPKIK